MEIELTNKIWRDDTMTTKQTVKPKKKRVYKGRNTGMFYGYLKRLAGYTDNGKDDIAAGIIESYLIGKYGSCHGRKVSLSSLTDIEYEELLNDLKRQANVCVDPEQLKTALNEKAVHTNWCHQIFKQLSRIGVSTLYGYEDANRHIRSLPVSRGRILPAIPVGEMPDVFKAVCSYCDNIRKKQQKEQSQALRN